MPRRRRSDANLASCKVRVASLNNNIHHFRDDHVLDDGLDGPLEVDLDECGSPLGSGSPQGHQPLQRNAANARERARMRVLSRAFCRLKTTLPWVPADTKLSKLDTLRLATSYIAHLRDVLLLGDAPEGSPAGLGSGSHAQHHGAINLTWPFTFPQPQPGAPSLAEPWLSRGSSSRLAGFTGAAGGANANLALGSGASSTASSSGADDDTVTAPVKDEDGQEDRDDGLACRRGLSGGRLVELQHGCLPYHQSQCHPFLARYVDVNSTGTSAL